jgi:hypothetical protein
VRRRLPLIGAVVLLLTVVIATAAGGAWTMDTGIDLPATDVTIPVDQAPEPVPTLAPPAPDPESPALPWIVVTILGIVTILIALGIVTAARHLLRRHTEPLPEPDEPDDTGPGPAPGETVNLPALVDAVGAALARLDAAATPTDAVVAAWVSLEDAAAAHGWERQPAQTSTEFTAHLLDVSPAPAKPAETLRRLYQQARFTVHPVTPEQVATARDALQAIATALDGRAP